MFVPEGKRLWGARDRDTWEREYDRHSALWRDEPEGMLVISELWKSEQTGTPGRRRRIEKWVQEVDEFGMMLFAVTSHIHGC